MATTQQTTSPYVGPRSFQVGETLYGRDRDLSKLLNLLIARRLVLLHSPSGAGKTSLIQAALIPQLQQEGFRVLPTIRVGTEVLAGGPAALPVGTGRASNRFVLATLLTLDEELPAEQQTRPEALADLTLAAYLAHRPRPDDGADEVLIFDQFEEVLTTEPGDLAAKEAFFAQLGMVLQDDRRWALFALREDYLGGLRPFLRPVPTRLETTYRLDLLDVAAAKQSMQGPARAVGVDFSDAAAQKLADDLRRTVIQRADGTSEEQLGPSIEPVQLQVVCLRLWEKLFRPGDADQGPARPAITVADVASVGDVDSALAAYYIERVREVAAETGVSERAIRDWVDGELITESGLRGQVLQQPGSSAGLDNRAIRSLIDAHLLRAEQRRGATWFELAHDRLVGPLRADNTRWREAHLSTLQRQAALWEQADRPDGLLLQGAALDEAQRWAAANQGNLTSDERAFLEECQAARAARGRERRANRLIRALAVIASFVMIAAIALLILALQSARRADAEAQRAKDAADQELQARQTAEAEAQRATQAEAAAESQRDEAERLRLVSLAQSLAAQASLQQSALKQDERSALLARQAYLFNQRSKLPLLDQVDAALRAVTSAAYTSYILGERTGWTWTPHENRYYAVAISHNSRLLAATSFGEVRIWNLERPGDPPTDLASAASFFEDIAFSPDDRLLAAAERGVIWVWNLSQPGAEPLQMGFANNADTSIAFSPDGQRIVSSSADGSINLWDLSQPAAPLLTRQGGGVALALSPDGGTLVTGSRTGEISLWDMQQLEADPVVLSGHTEFIIAAAFSPNGRSFATSGYDKTLRLWPLPGPDAPPPTVIDNLSSVPLSLAFSPDGRTLAGGGIDGVIRLFDTNQPSAAPVSLYGHTDLVQGLAFSGDGRFLTSASNDRTLRLWSLRNPYDVTTRLVAHAGPVRSVAFSTDGQTLASGGDDATLRLWGLNQPTITDTIIWTNGSPINSVAFSPDGSALAASGGDTAYITQDNPVWVWDLRQPGSEPLRLDGAKGGVNAIAFSPDGQLLAASSYGEDAVRLWNLRQPAAAPRAFTNDRSFVWSLAISPDGAWLGSSGLGNAVWLRDLRRPDAEELTLSDQPGGVRAIAFSPDSTVLAAATDNGVVQLWQLAAAVSPPPPTLLRGHEGAIQAMAFSPDGRLLASAGDDRTVRIWALDKPESAPMLLRNHTASITALAFSPDGRTLASSDMDGTIVLTAVDSAELADIICKTIWRNLTLAEWNNFVGADLPYERTCLNLPPATAE